MAFLRESHLKCPPDILLQMDHWVEDLSPAQQSFYNRAEKECSEILSRINDFIKKDGAEILERGQDIMVLQATGGSPAAPSLNALLSSSKQLQQPQQTPTIQAVPSQQLLIQGGPVQTSGRASRQTNTQVPTFQPTSGTFQLVMDPRLGLIVAGTVPNQQPSSNPVVQSTTTSQPIQSAPVQPVTTTRSRPTSSVRPVSKAPVPKALVPKAPVTTATSNQSRVALPVNTTVATTTATTTTYRVKPKTSATVSSSVVTPISTPTPTIPASGNRPTENNSIGGLSAGTPSKKTGQDDSKSGGPDSREVTFSKMSGKTFPSLVVIARPHLRMKDIPQTKINQERASLDGKVKCVLMYTATKFTEWLIQQGLVRSDQYCSVHSNSSGPFKLKLGMYSDVTKFPYSGGYVWISECCPARFVSVFSGSIFEGAPHPPSVLLKLMYHWCCQTNVQNVVQWVKVDNFYVKNFFTLMRSVCVAAVHELHEKLGGPQKKVEVGVISLGTTSQDGNMRQVKVEVLGVMDHESKLVRLRAVEPLQDGERNYKRRFVKILEPLEYWVHKESVILTDFTVDKGTLQSMGFTQVHQSTIPESPAPVSNLTNHNIMEYLRRIVPRMFQNTLSLLSRQIIQQFLDELVWRERWGPVPSQAFDSLVSHLAAQTKLDSGESLLVKLGKIAANPFRKWDYAYWQQNGLTTFPPFASGNVGNNSQTTASRTSVMLYASINGSNSQWVQSNRSGAGAQKPANKEILDKELLSDPKSCQTSIALRRTYEFKVGEDVEMRLTKALENMGKGMSLRKAVETFKVSKSLLMERAQTVLGNKKIVGPTVFSPDEEQDIVDHLFTLHDWGYPFGRWDIRLVVKQYLDCSGRIEPKFKENFPGDLWIEKFLSRHSVLKEKLCRNIPSRGTFVDTDSVQQYILNLSSALQRVPPSNIVNFMEVGLTGDPLRSMTVELRDLRYPVGKRKVKSSSAMMLSCTGAGRILPTYIIFEGRSVSISKGPAPGEYYGAKCGWFDECAFQQWLETVLLPWADGVPGKKIVIGDSLAQLFTVKTQALCMDKDILFVCMPCNITNILSPLDVVLFEKMKSQWRNMSRAWATANGDKFISVEEFPAHIYELLCTSIGPDIQGQLTEAFKRVGLFPFSSKAAVQALESAGVSLNDVKDQPTAKQGDHQNDGRKSRKRVFNADISSKKGLKGEGTSEVEEFNSLNTDQRNQLQADLVSLEAALESSTDLVSLEEHYYGTKDSDQDVLSREYHVENLNAKCPMCQTFVNSNLELMKHILGHSEDNACLTELSNLIKCKYCVQIFETTEDLAIHLREMHKNFSSPLVCLICVKKFQSRQKLILHMHKTHTQLELPYQCSICSYRSSEQYKLVDHFYEVHANGEKVQCPFCLKCVAISSFGKKMPANTFFFMHHVRKHQSKSTARQCDKCSLWFVHKGILREHQQKDHISLKNDPGIVPYSSKTIDGIMMPLPGASMPSSGRETCSKYTKKLFDSFHINGLSDKLLCAECKLPFTANHVQSFMACLRCSFSTCCSDAMAKHEKEFHSKDKPSPVHDLLLNLSEEMYCVCGFMSRNGNALANHLVLCGRKSAYTSAACAKAATAPDQSASFPPLVTLDEGELTSSEVNEKWLQAFTYRKDSDSSRKEKSDKRGKEQPSMLNLLGLVRKNSNEENNDKHPSPVCTDDENSKERPTSRGSNGSGSFRSRKRVAEDAGLDSVDCTEVQTRNSSPSANHSEVSLLVKKSSQDLSNISS